MERYKSVMHIINAKLRRGDSKYNCQTAKPIRQKSLSDVQVSPIYAHLKLPEKLWWTEKITWEALFPQEHFPGTRPGRKVSPDAQPKDTEVSQSSGDNKDPECTSASKEDENNTPDIESETSQSDTETPNESSELSRKVDGAILDHTSASTYIESPMLLQSNGRPMFSTDPIKHDIITLAETFGRDHSSVEAIQKCFPGVRVGTGRFGFDFLFFAEPFSLNNKGNEEILEQCNKCWWFLECYRKSAEASPGYLSGEVFLNSSEWDLKKNLGRSFESHQSEMAEFWEANSHKPLRSHELTDSVTNLEEGMGATTFAESTSSIELEQSSRKRKSVSRDQDYLQSSELAPLGQMKRVKSQKSPKSDNIRQLWDPPRYSILANRSPEEVKYILSCKNVAENHFGVEFGCCYFKEELTVYCKPIEGISFNAADTLCKPAFNFLKEFLDQTDGNPTKIDDYLALSSQITEPSIFESA